MKSRGGYTRIELIISAMILSTLFGFMATILPRLDQLWGTTRYYQIANQEIMNHMEALMCLTPDECQSAIESLAISNDVMKVIPEAKLEGLLVKSKEGNRVVLTMQLPDRIRVEPIVLVGFLLGEDGS
jgi:hypothetical protein